MSSKSKTGEPPERPTEETLSHGEYREEPVSIAPGAKTRLRKVDGSEIDRLYLKGSLTQDEHHTLLNFQEDLYNSGLIFCPRAGIIPTSTAGSAQFIGDAAFRRAARMAYKMQALRDGLGHKDMSLFMDAMNIDRRMVEGQEDIPAKAAQILTKFYEYRAKGC